MKILIIEDETNAAADLHQMLLRYNSDFIIEGVTDSIESSLEWLSMNNQPDLIFCDIQLADGLSFEIFKRHLITCPVIFTTAYDEYAIQAFELNGVGYLLKPTDETKLAASLKKVEMLRESLSGQSAKSPSLVDLNRLLSSFELNKKAYKTTLMISYKGKIFPLQISDISCFTIRNKITFVYTSIGKSYMVVQNLEDLEQKLNPMEFFRANRQNLIAFKAIKEVEPYLGRTTLVHLNINIPEKIVVSKPRGGEFLSWMEDR